MLTQPDPTGRATPAHLMLREVWSMGDLALIDEIVEPTHVYHDPVVTDPGQGPEALKTTIELVRDGIPDLRKVVDDEHVAGDTVFLTYTASGTHDGPFLGLEPTSRSVEIDGVYIGRVTETDLVRSTDRWDVYGLLNQIGALPPALAGGYAPRDRTDTHYPRANS